MEELRRRTLLGTGAALVAGGSLASARTGNVGQQSSIEEPEGWSSYDGNPANGRYVPAEDGIAKPDTVAWEYEEAGDLAVVDGTVYLRTYGNEIHALDAADGSVEWTNETISAEGAPAVANDTVYVGGGQLTALNAADGSVRWQRKFDFEPAEYKRRWGFPVSSPTIVDGRLYVAVDGTIYALDPTDGSTDWKRDTVDVDLNSHPEYKESNIETFQFETEPVSVANGSVYAVTEEPGEATVALDAMTGENQWTSRGDLRVEGPLTASETAVYGHVSGQPGSHRINAETGEQWVIVYGIYADATKGDIRATYDDARVRVETYSDDSGNELWTSPAFPRSSVGDGGSIAIIGQTLLFTLHPNLEEDKSAIAYDLADGSERWVVSNSDDIDISPIKAVDSETIYDDGSDGLRALRSTDNTEDSGGDENKGSDDENESGGDGTNGETGNNGDRTDDRTDDTDGDSNGDENESTEAGGDNNESDTDGATDENGSTADGNGSGVDNDTEDSTPGFTPIASLAAGALGLEGLRRRALGDETDRE
ncbi:PQQ-binding-like beta-propeller repeat protein [Natrinema zhouii]|uniref:PQQ-binding-like beta-propeller repeat protein n=1 Tax=Natrinema zhouii TaxID=1710539 RepID=A0A7D6CQQ7_9EURY|nr:PQQ-binding-like beta-propeller repeat protein [Natrinema zhouii]QLK27475.1 PQQ-binding-like beta-propeller repeat protein [Natrinema zhouii]